MRLPRVRLTVRRIMAAVAIVGVVLGYWQTRGRWAGFRDRASYHGRLEAFYREAIDDPSGWLRLHPELETHDPEPPPISPHAPEAWEPAGCRLLTAYHARLRRYWASRW